MSEETTEHETFQSEEFDWPAQTYTSIMHELNIPEEAHSSASSTPVNAPISASCFMTRYEMKRIAARESISLEVDLRDLDFVEPPNESLVCTICAAPFVKPMELGCEHTFCEDCIYGHLSCGIPNASLCPKCRQPVETLKPVPRLLNQLLDELEVECPNRYEGCLQRLKRYTVNDHVSKYCEYEELRCPKSNCGGSIQRRFYDKGCLHTHIECDVCSDLVMEKDIADHEENKCPAALVNCDCCHAQLRRGRVKTHLEVDCPMTTIKCVGHVVGCKFEDRRMVMDEHIASCPMATMSSYFAEMNERQQTLQEENKRLRCQVDSLNAKLEALEGKYTKLAESIKKERHRSMNTETSAVSANRIDELHARLNDLTADYNTRLDNATSEAARLHMEMMNYVQQNGQRFYTVNGTITALRSQINHLLSMTRLGGNGGTSGNGSLTSGGSDGGGVSLETTRREPPKL
ncbi:uncharacterized protein PV09_02351 [Verruconis gallopava]|uniref:RING-type domain-containing protein n=1 Tax=Verruconis gallopava TaxID=253628 RepID=A0A0D2B5Y3_9PEZI|nr:uncharacterized protein PV09_02351 [Verruconis gallopava]KIW06639.1 hypothetical protein PV09_02351 [Verruconis gallopava]